jgi:hypothetical protein
LPEVGFVRSAISLATSRAYAEATSPRRGMA